MWGVSSNQRDGVMWWGSMGLEIMLILPVGHFPSISQSSLCKVLHIHIISKISPELVMLFLLALWSELRLRKLLRVKPKFEFKLG